MRTTKRAVLALGLVLAGGLAIGDAVAAPMMTKPAAFGDQPLVEPADYVYRGRNYCWYYDGWHGPGWYWCGYAWRRGYGWGSPVWGWNNWAWSGPRYYRGPVYRSAPVYRGGPGRYYGRPGYYGGHHRH